MTTPLPISQFIGPRPDPGLRPTNPMSDRAGGFADRLDAARARLAETAQRPDPTVIDRRSPNSVIASERPSTSSLHDAVSKERGPSDQRDRSATETNAESTAAGDSGELRSTGATDVDAADSNAAVGNGAADPAEAGLGGVGAAAEGVDEHTAATTPTVEGAEAGRSIEPEDAAVGAVDANMAIDRPADHLADSAAVEDTVVEDTVVEDTVVEDTVVDDTAVDDTAVDDTAAAAVTTERSAAGHEAGDAQNAVAESTAAEGTSAQNAAEEHPVSESPESAGTVARDTAVDHTVDRDDDHATEIRPEQAAAQAAALATVATPQRPTASASSEVTAAETGPDEAVIESSTAGGAADGDVVMSEEALPSAVTSSGQGTHGLGAETGEADQSLRATTDPAVAPRPSTPNGSASADTMSMPAPPVGPVADSSSSPLVTSMAPSLGDDVEAQLWDQVSQALGRVRASEDGQELRMRLRPADLGELLIQVHTRGDHVSVRLATTNDGARQALLDDQARLAEELANAGFQGASVDVRQENDGGNRSGRDDDGPVRFDRADTLPSTRRREAILRHHRRSSIELTL